MVGGHKPGIKQEKSAEVRTRQGQQRMRQEQEQDTGPRKNTHQGRDCRSGHPLNTPA
ncbi:unnamed protein product [Staurois parvus]|uniref:Small EDRK-rich factor-like N-terminal domain-containing protein n=1 Tax=Staurois parvus TaxID=386267 RepID=A0ABN9AZ24_9NEOB|nr:unnamed protein product [Staurois parvus]